MIDIVLCTGSRIHIVDNNELIQFMSNQQNILNVQQILRIYGCGKIALYDYTISLDVTLFSNCLNLKVFKYDGVGKLTEQRNLEFLQKCTKLKILDVRFDCINSLKGLENCVDLEKLNVSNNQITSLNEIKKCTKLKSLKIGHNKITSIDQCKYFTNLKKLYCYTNYLPNIKCLSECQELLVLQCQCNEINSFNDIENHVKISNFEGFNNNCLHENITRIFDDDSFSKLTPDNITVNHLKFKKLRESDLFKLNKQVILQRLGITDHELELIYNNNPIIIPIIESIDLKNKCDVCCKECDTYTTCDFGHITCNECRYNSNVILNDICCFCTKPYHVEKKQDVV
jgi:hypothetical protein